MSSEVATTGEFQTASVRERGNWQANLARKENLLVSLALATMVILPVLEALLRRTLHGAGRWHARRRHRRARTEIAFSLYRR